MAKRTVLAALAVAIWAAPVSAEIIVDDPQQITRRVSVQLIQTANDSDVATAFGDSTQRAHIENGIDSIWAQAGIDIHFLPGYVSWNNAFAYQGNAGSGTRPGGDLSLIIDSADDAGKLNPDPLVLNLFFVNVVPAFSPRSESTVAGYARLDGNGMAGFVGDNLLTDSNGRDVVARVMAHEIGHNLGLLHTGNNQPNLMSSGGTTEQLDASQIDTARSSNFARLIPAVLAGDYNSNGIVDAADFTIWRSTLGQIGSGLAADGNSNGRIDNADYTVWKTNFGAIRGAGSGAPLVFTSAAISPVPEPNTLVSALIALLPLILRRNMPR